MASFGTERQAALAGGVDVKSGDGAASGLPAAFLGVQRPGPDVPELDRRAVLLERDRRGGVVGTVVADLAAGVGTVEVEAVLDDLAVQQDRHATGSVQDGAALEAWALPDDVHAVPPVLVGGIRRVTERGGLAGVGATALRAGPAAGDVDLVAVGQQDPAVGAVGVLGEPELEVDLGVGKRLLRGDVARTGFDGDVLSLLAPPGIAAAGGDPPAQIAALQQRVASAGAYERLPSAGCWSGASPGETAGGW